MKSLDPAQWMSIQFEAKKVVITPRNRIERRPDCVSVLA
jgi:hypothetical protein